MGKTENTEFKKGDFKKMIEKFANVLDSSGDFLVVWGKTENKNPDHLKLMKELSENPKNINLLLEKVPSEYKTKFFGIMLRLSLIAQKYNKTKLSNSEDKIEIGKQLKDLAKEFQDLEK